MKTKLIFTAAVTLFALTSGVYAGDAVLSPRAKELQNSLRKVPGSTVDMIDRSDKTASPRALDLAHSLRKVPSQGAASIDLVHGSRPLLSPRDPRYETAFRELRQREFQVAPLK